MTVFGPGATSAELPMGEDAVVRGCNGSALFWPIGECPLQTQYASIAAIRSASFRDQTWSQK